MSKGNGANSAEQIYNKKLEEKLGEIVQIVANVPKTIFEGFIDHAVSNGCLDINSALIQVMKDVSRPKRGKVKNPNQG